MQGNNLGWVICMNSSVSSRPLEVQIGLGLEDRVLGAFASQLVVLVGRVRAGV